MRLIRTDTLELEEFFDNNIPKYAILSHTWGQGEVSFRDMQDGKTDKKAGYSKIKHSSDQAAADGFKYVWVDTCCIDKTSSAELSEAINSMYQWYKSAEVCYAYLSDVSREKNQNTGEASQWYPQPDSTFFMSRWFKRGWTLQELIAPSSLYFFDKDWNCLGPKIGLNSAISALTGIDVEILDGSLSPLDVSIARRMSWAMNRQTTRVEDIAYCLIGIFDVNMPLIYGEGKKAFTRLQEEILKDSDDHSLFAWKTVKPRLQTEAMPLEASYRGILADSPAEFADSRDIVPFRDWSHSAPYSMTNKGLSIRLILEGGVSEENQSVFIAGLNCRLGEDHTERVGIYLLCIQGDQYARIRQNEITTTSASIYDSKAIFIRKNPLAVGTNDTVRGNVFRIFPPEPYWGYTLNAGYPAIRWDKVKRLLYPSNVVAGNAGVLRFQIKPWIGFWAILGRDSNDEGWCHLRVFSGMDTLESIYRSFNYGDAIRKSGPAVIDVNNVLHKVTASVTKEEVKGYTEYHVHIEIEEDPL